MSYSFQITPDECAELILEGEPPYCRVLPMAPVEREPELNQGLWLVLLFAAWSGPDRRAIPIALSVVKGFQGRVRLGIRKFSDHTEQKTWCPEVREKWGGPIWLMLRDGELREELTGLRSEEQLRDWVQHAMNPD